MSLTLSSEYSRFTTGNKISGRVTIRAPHAIRNIRIELRGIETCEAKGHSESCILESSYADLGSEWNDGEARPFELHIPAVANRSYRARSSEYRWESRTKVDVPYGKDLLLSQTSC